MKVTLQVLKHGTTMHEGTYDVSDAESFGRACAHLWTQLRERKLAKASSVGALFDALDDQLLEELYGAEISLSKAQGGA